MPVSMTMVLSVCLAAAPLKGDLAKVQGVWRLMSVEASGVSMDKEDLQMLEVIVRGDKCTVMRNGETTDSRTLRLDENHKPKHFEYTYPMGEHKGQTLHGIYELSGDTWKVCLAMPGKPRPKEFKAGPGSDDTLYIMKRNAKK